MAYLPVAALPGSPSTISCCMRRLFLVDGTALAYRAHYSMVSRPLVNSRGENTSAAYGFTTALLRLLDRQEMDHVVVVFDMMGGGPTFRTEMYDEYKAHRDPPPEDLVANLPWIKEIVGALRIPVLEEPEVEADDVIGTLARRAEADGAEVVIVSPDKDFQQLLSPGISIFKPAYRGGRLEPVTASSFRKAYGIEPAQYIDLLALTGDASDNVPGVPGIGPKTATKLLQAHGSVETVLAAAPDMQAQRPRKALLAGGADALLSKRLVTIRTDLEVDLDWERASRQGPDTEALSALFRRLEFRGLARRVLEGRQQDGQAELFAESDSPLSRYDPDQVRYRTLAGREDLDAFCGQLRNQDVVALDTETTSVDAMRADLVGISLSWRACSGVYVPVPLADGTGAGVICKQVGDALTGLVVGQNLKYDLVVLERHGMRPTRPFFDTMVAHYLVAPEGEHGLDALARRYLGYEPIPIAALLGTGKTQRSMREVPVEAVAPYACEDADITFRLYEVLREDLRKAGLYELACEVEFPLMAVLASMEIAGVRVDTDMLGDISRRLTGEMERLEEAIYEHAGQNFNLQSSQQTAHILYDVLGLDVLARTASGKPSTRESVLQQLAARHPLPALLLDWRKCAKLRGTYLRALSGLVHPVTGRVHTQFNQTVAATGRLSSSNPNLQNIPVRSKAARQIRRAFTAQEGWRIMAADYAQIEMRILASMSGDESLVRDLRSGVDVHAATAARIFGVAQDAITREQRSRAKEVNYGIPYGLSPWGLAQRLRCELQEAEAMIDGYHAAYPGVSRWLRKAVEQARECGYAETVLGRRRHIPHIRSRNRVERAYAERVAVNMPIQGTQADMIKIAMIGIHEGLRKLDSRMILQVHDELVFEVAPGEEESVRRLVEHEMTTALPLATGIRVDIRSGSNWLEAH